MATPPQDSLRGWFFVRCGKNLIHHPADGPPFPEGKAVRAPTGQGSGAPGRRALRHKLHSLSRFLDIENLREPVAILAPVLFSKHSQQEIGALCAPSLSGRNKGEEEVARGRNPGWGFLPFALRAEVAAHPGTVAGKMQEILRNLHRAESTLA